MAEMFSNSALAHVGAGPLGAENLAAADHVHAAALLGQKLADVQVAATLDRVADDGGEFGKGLTQTGVVVDEGLPGVDVQGRPGPRGQVVDAHVFAVKLAVSVYKVVHATAPLDSKPGIVSRWSIFRTPRRR
jgi:hypothetical protein